MRWALLTLVAACRFDSTPIGDALTGDDATGTKAQCADTDLGSALGSAVASGTLTNADGDDFTACAGHGTPDRAFGWTAPAAGSYTFSICNSEPSWDSVLLVYTDAVACSGMPMCRDDDCSMHERITLTLAAGQRIVVVIDGWLERGPYVLDITQN